jgi:hypothetical protein
MAIKLIYYKCIIYDINAFIAIRLIMSKQLLSAFILLDSILYSADELC